MQIAEENVAELLLWPLWRCIADGYKQQYKKDVWDHFENAIKSASYTDNLKVFLSNFQKRIPTDLQAQYSKDILKIIDSGEDEKVLNWIRTESTYLVIMVRLKNQERKDSFSKDEVSSDEETIGDFTINDNGEFIKK